MARSLNGRGTRLRFGQKKLQPRDTRKQAKNCAPNVALVLLRKKHRLLLVQRIYPRMVVGARGEKHPISGADVGAQWLHHRRGEPGVRIRVIYAPKAAFVFTNVGAFGAKHQHETCLQSEVLLVAGSASGMKIGLTFAYFAVPHRTRHLRHRRWGSAKRTARRNTPATCTRFPTTDTSRCDDTLSHQS